MVRVVHNWFASTDDWDDQMEGHTYGWVAFFRILRLYLARFRGQHGVSFQVMATAPEPKAAAWNALLAPLGIVSPAVGGRIATVPGAPPLAGTVHSIGQLEWPELLVETDAAGSGIAHFFPLPMAGQVFLTGRLYLFGDDAAAVAARAQPVWQQMDRRTVCAGRWITSHADDAARTARIRAAVRVGSRTLSDEQRTRCARCYCGGVQ